MQFYTWKSPPKDRSKEHLGGKGAGLFDMLLAGVPVPEFVVIPTSACVGYMAKPAEGKMAAKAAAQNVIDCFIDELGYLPLLSVRSGARVSMPGMMDTILNVGIGDALTNPYTKKLPPKSFADCQRRFLQMYGSTVLGIDSELFEKTMTSFRAEAGVQTDAELSAGQLGDVAMAFQQVYKSNGKNLSLDARTQIECCILAVMDSWNGERAVAYRNEMGIPHDWGTAVVIQRMVFGNMNDNSSSGVLFSRCAATGKNELTGEFLPNAQGEDVVAGIRKPLPLVDLPEPILTKLASVVDMLEQKYLDMLDIEFTVEDGQLYLLQVRTAKRSARAWVRSTLDMLKDGLLDDFLPNARAAVYQRIKREHVRLLSRPVVDPSFQTKPHIVGLPACAGVVTGIACFSAPAAVALKEAGQNAILIRHETSPDDIAGMFASVGILTATGGATSHAAVVARGMDKVCVTGAESMSVSENKAQSGGWVIKAGSKVTIDGSTGNVWIELDVPVSDPTSDKDLADLIQFVEAGCPPTQDVVLPGSPGSVYMASQFLAEVPLPTAEAVTIFDDGAECSQDPLFMLTGEPNILHLMSQWLDKGDKGATATVVNVGGKSSLKDLLQRPIRPEELTNCLGSDLDDLRLLVAPAKLEDKFQFVGCQRYRLLAAFK